MKTSAVIRIVIYALIAIFLCGILISGLAGQLPQIGHFSIGGIQYSYADSDKYQAFGNKVTLPVPDGLNKLDLDWISGNIQVNSYSGDTIVLETNAAGTEQAQQPHYAVINHTLYLKFCASGVKTGIFKQMKDKQLTVWLPKTLALDTMGCKTISASAKISGLTLTTLTAESVSGNQKFDHVSAQNADVQTVSGTIQFTEFRTQGMDLETVSGEVSYQGSVSELSANSVSASVSMQSEVCPHKVDVETTSGEIMLAIPQNSGFTAHHNSVSGQFITEFACTGDKKKAICGDGSADFELETVSGGISIQQND